MTDSKDTAGDFREAMEVQLIYAALANEALGSYLVDPARLDRLRRVFNVAYEQLKKLPLGPGPMCNPDQVHIGCQCWPKPKGPVAGCP